MANYATLKSVIEDNIKQNGAGAITGPVLQSALLTMVNSLGAGFQFAGIATPDTIPGAPDQNVFYIAATTGAYSNFGGIILVNGEVAALKWNGSWSKETAAIVSNEAAKIISRGVFVDYGHLVNITGQTINYVSNNNFDALHVRLASGRGTLSVSGAVRGRFCYFSAAEPVQDNYLGQNTTGVIPENAKYVVINLSRASNPNGYANLIVAQDQDYIYEPDFRNIFGNYVRDVPTGVNYLDANNLLNGYQIAGGQVVANANGKMSNKLFLSDGETYTIQGIPYYGTYMRCYYAKYSITDEYLGTGRVDVTDPDEDGRGTGTFVFDSNNDHVAYIRFCVQASTSASFNSSIAQIEVGSAATTVVPYTKVEKFFPTEETIVAKRRKLRLLAIGNSYDQDALAYVPFIMQDMGIDADVEIGILMMSSSTIQDHIDNFINETAAYTFYHYEPVASAWVNRGSKTIQWALETYVWDVISTHASSSQIEPALASVNTLANLLHSALTYPVRFAWIPGQIRPAVANSGANRSDETISQLFEASQTVSESVINGTAFDIIIPVCAAVQNARTIASLKALGAYAQNELNTSGNGYLCPNDGVHLQEGLPCQLAAYTVILSLLDLLGFGSVSIYGEQTRVSSAWASDKAIPSPHGSYIEPTDDQCRLIQLCAIMAHKHPFEVTDMNPIVSPSA